MQPIGCHLEDVKLNNIWGENKETHTHLPSLSCIPVPCGRPTLTGLNQSLSTRKPLKESIKVSHPCPGQGGEWGILNLEEQWEMFVAQGLLAMVM